MFFTTASLLLLFRWLNSGYKSRYLLFAGICCGLAAGTKYNGLINIFLLTLFIPVLYIRSQNGGTGSNSRGITCSLLFLMATLVAFSPWLIRNYAWTGNPIYPLHNSLFQKNPAKSINQEEPEQTNSIEVVKQLASRGSGVFASRKILYHETWWQALLLPVRFFFEGQDDNPRYFDGRLNPFLLILPFFAFFKKSPTRSLQLEKYTLLSFSDFLLFLYIFSGIDANQIYSLHCSPDWFCFQSLVYKIFTLFFLKSNHIGSIAAQFYSALWLLSPCSLTMPLILLNKLDAGARTCSGCASTSAGGEALVD